MKKKNKTPEQVAMTIKRDTIFCQPKVKDTNPIEIQQSLQDNTPEKTVTKYRTRYRDGKTGLMKDVTNHSFLAMAQKIRAWADSSHTNIRFNSFCRDEGIPKQTLYDLAKESPEIRDAIDYALLAIADNREMGAVFIERGMREKSCLFQIQRYDPEIRKEMEWESKLRDKQEAQPTTINVHLEDFGDDDRVPAKKAIKG
jgi:hypothetical protein